MTEPGRHRAPEQALPGERMVPVGAAVFLLGVVAAVATFVPFLLDQGRDEPPIALVLATSVALPLGLGIALLGLLRGARARRRAARRSSIPT
jgi:hypothetical protein